MRAILAIVIRPAFVFLSLALLLLACVGDEADPNYAKPPTQAEYLKSCRAGACPPTEANCNSAFACQVDLFSSYKVRDVMQCLQEANACMSCTDAVASQKYSTDAGNMILACKGAADQCKGFSCPQALRLYRDDLIENLTSCYKDGCTAADPYKVVKCLNRTAYAKAPKCQTSCCSGNKFYACPSDDAANDCIKGNTDPCTATTSLDGLCAP